MSEQQFAGFWRLIGNLSQAGILSFVQVIGSWAEYLYGFCMVLPGFHANLRTLDIDFLVMNQRKPKDRIHFTDFARRHGYLLAQDSLSGATKLFTQDALEVEFLIAQQGSSTQDVLPTNIGVHAQALSHLDILRDHLIELQINDLFIKVPLPEAYVIHKCVIHSRRGGKQQKDMEAILSLLPYLNRDNLLDIAKSLTRRQKQAARDTCRIIPEHCKELLMILET